MVVVMGRKNSIYPLKNSTEINLDDNNQLKMPIEMNEGTQKEMGANQTMTNILETKMMCFFFPFYTPLKQKTSYLCIDAAFIEFL